MKEARHLAASDATASASQIVNIYAERWTIEPEFRDAKDLRFGIGLGVLRMAVRNAATSALLTALAVLLRRCWAPPRNLDRPIARTAGETPLPFAVPPGLLLYDIIPNMPEQRLRPLVEKYEEFLNRNNVFTQTFGPA